MNVGRSIVEFSVKHPKVVTWTMVLVTLCLGIIATLPTIWPHTFRALHPMKVDTDPENMLPGEEPVRIFHNRMKQEMSIHDIMVLGVVNETHPDGVFNPESLGKVYELTKYASSLRWPDEDNPAKQVGVIEVDLIAPSTVDNIEPGGPGVVRFEWLMPSPPATREESLAVRSRAQRIPFLNGTLVSEDGKALCLYLPLTSKDISYRVYSKLREKVSSLGGPEQYFITGLPVAEDTFGVEMFKQMAISAPAAMVVIFLLMLLFFRNLVVIVSPMIVAVVSAICTMGLLIATGNTVHIMSSMIPIFIVPIAVLDAVHIISEFFDRYQESRDRRATILNVMDTLFTPMLYTSLTTAVGFASLALTPIPPVQVFGLFVALGVVTAWAWTVIFIPAYIMFIREESLENFGLVHARKDTKRSPFMARVLARVGSMTYRYAKPILAFALATTVVAIYGITRIQINDNPVKWFTSTHPIRVADRVLNRHFGGTYMAYLALESQEREESPHEYADVLVERITTRAGELNSSLPSATAAFRILKDEAIRHARVAPSKKDLLAELESYARWQAEAASEGDIDVWDEALLFIDEERQRGEIFKQPSALRYVSALQAHLVGSAAVGKTNSLPDIVKTVYRDLLSGEEEYFAIPKSAKAVAQCLITYQNSHRPRDLWHFVTPDYKKTVIWAQLRSGDNKDMSQVVRAVDGYIAENPPPYPLTHRWFGLTYINVIWQQKMVSGMLRAFLGSFLCVFLMMTLLYRSALWGIMCMVPLTVTIGFIYGVVGLIGKDYDMPIAVLSSLSLGLAVDYAIHFLSRTRALYESHGSWVDTTGAVFGEPARAIVRNVIVVGVGFLPLLLARLVPYKTVGTFIACILSIAGVATLFILPSLTTLFEKVMFPQTRVYSLLCNCTTCTVSAVAIVALVAMSVRQSLTVGWTSLTLLSIGAIAVLAATCFFMSRRERCRTE